MRVAIYGDGTERGTRLCDYDSGQPLEGDFNIIANFSAPSFVMVPSFDLDDGFRIEGPRLPHRPVCRFKGLADAEYVIVDLVEIVFEDLDRQMFWFRRLGAAGGYAVG